MAVNS